MLYKMFELGTDISSINSFTNSYHKLKKSKKTLPEQKLNLPCINGHLFLSTKFNVQPLREHIKQRGNKDIPIFTFASWAKIRLEVRVWFRKYFHQKVKEINSGNLITLNPGQSMNIRTDHFCLSPHLVYTTLIPLQRSDMNSASLAISQEGLVWAAESEQDLFQKLHKREFSWDYTILEEGEAVVIGRDAIYGSFRNDSEQPHYYLQMRWVKHDHSSSSSNSS